MSEIARRDPREAIAIADRLQKRYPGLTGGEILAYALELLDRTGIPTSDHQAPTKKAVLWRRIFRFASILSLTKRRTR